MPRERSAPEHVIAISVEGTLTGECIAAYRGLVEDKLADHARVCACLDLTGLSDVASTALLQRGRPDLDLFGHFNRLYRCAFIADKDWPRATLAFLQTLMPNVEMRTFSGDQGADALRWASDVSEATLEPQVPAIRFLPTTKERVFAFEIHGVVSSAEMPRIIRAMNLYMEQHDRVRLFNRLMHFGGFDPSVFLQNGLVSTKISAMEKVERYALVGAPGWVRRIIDPLSSVFPEMNIRTFSIEQENEAWEWIGDDGLAGNAN